MTHVQITTPTRGAYRILVEGHDITDHVMRDGFKIEIPEDHDEFTPSALVHVVIAADTLDLDLPHSVIEAVRERTAPEELVTEVCDEHPACLKVKSGGH